jgi:NTP pyrophosphatase (non-canonical NTP hydrolase)
MSEIDALARRLRKFADAREWAQFHTPKNLAMALAGEVGELLAELQWLTPAETTTVMADDPDAAARIRAELGDVMIYLVRLADVLDVGLVDAANAKTDANEERYSTDTYRGSARKAPQH